MTNLISVTETSGNTPERVEVIYAARLTLGYIYFELSSYERALKQLQSIPKEFYDYPEVLLTIGWCSFKLNDYDGALRALKNLVTHYKDYYNLEEAYFVIGQCYLKLGYYDYAIREYDKILSASANPIDFQKRLEQTRQDLARKENELEDLSAQLIVLEAEALKASTLSSRNGAQMALGKTEAAVDHKNKIQKVESERLEFEQLQDVLENLKKQLDKAEGLEDWRAYAEYGKARALYLKSVGN
ncbi:MAG: tetratricopeptide repeat protein [bacterium]